MHMFVCSSNLSKFLESPRKAQGLHTFQWMFWGFALTYGDNFVNSHLDCTFEEFFQEFVDGTTCCKQMNKLHELVDHQTKFE